MLALWLAALLLLPGCMWKKLGGGAEQETELEQAQNVTEDTAGETELTEPSGQDPGSAETPDPEPSAPVLIDPINPPDNPPEPAPADPAEQFPAPAPDDGHVHSISLDKYKVVVQVGQSDMPWVTMYPESAENKGEIWTSNDTAVATVNSWGNITGVNEGSCQVTVRSADNPDVKAVVDVTVTARQAIHVDSLTLDKDEVNITVGLPDMPIVTMYPTTATDKGEIWESDNASVATVNHFGLITGVGIGVCTVTVKSKDNPDASASVTVKVTARPNYSEVTYINGILVVNKTYGLPSTYNPGVDPTAKSALDSMIAGAEKDGIKLWVESGFRSYELQTTIYTSYVSREGQKAADRYSARPGHSEHQTGLAFDMNSFDQTFGSTPEGMWLSEHSWEYGFTMRYPKDKEDITGFMYEPWHVRYVGYEVAKALKDSGQVLEEYLGITSAYPG
jgi:LAS superfamily LD-carboxypeptidase LdcB